MGPITRGNRMVGFLAPTYMPSDSPFYRNTRTWAPLTQRECVSSLRLGDSVAASPCFPRAYPPQDDLRGRRVEFRYTGDVLTWLKWYGIRRQGDYDGWYHTSLPHYFPISSEAE